MNSQFLEAKESAQWTWEKGFSQSSKELMRNLTADTKSIMATMVSVFSLTNDPTKEKLFQELFDTMQNFQYFLIFLSVSFLIYSVRIKFIDNTKSILNKFSVAIDEVEIENSISPHSSEALYLTQAVLQDHRRH